MAIEIVEVGESTTEAAAAAAAAAASVLNRSLLNKVSEFDQHMGAYHDGYVTGEDIETEDTTRNTNRTAT